METQVEKLERQVHLLKKQRDIAYAKRDKAQEKYDNLVKNRVRWPNSDWYISTLQEQIFILENQYNEQQNIIEQYQEHLRKQDENHDTI